MRVRAFVTTSAILLTAWLGITFVHEVPASNYPRLGKGSLPISAEAKTPAKNPLPSVPDLDPVLAEIQ